MFMTQEVPFVRPQRKMSQEDFNTAIAAGQQLSILDELVVNVGPYIEHHPGGAFLLRYNIGKNIGKFFHGSYTLEGNLVPGGMI